MAVESGKACCLSAAYMFDPVFEKGEFKGEHYDFIMTNIRGNHVALVDEGRAGPEVAVADGAPKERENFMGIIEKIKDLVACLQEDEEKLTPPLAPLMPPKGDEGEHMGLDEENPNPEFLIQKLWALIHDIKDIQLAEKLKTILTELGLDLEPLEIEAQSLETPEGGPNLSTDEIDEEEKPLNITPHEHLGNQKQGEPALDKKLSPKKIAQTVVLAKTRHHFRQLFEAARRVRPLVGDIDQMAFDSAADIYAYTLKSKGVPSQSKNTEILADMVEILLAEDRKNLNPAPAFKPALNFKGPFAALSNIKLS
ncbi:MAG: DUF2213 domain-containing protein, partial [Candidatus Adiutrix sp.]